MADDAETTDATKEAEEVDATQAHTADRAPTSEEEAAAERSTEKFAADKEAVAEHYEEMSDLGAKIKGEGEIE
jgi:hypothetical protein